jgi:membrane protein
LAKALAKAFAEALIGGGLMLAAAVLKARSPAAAAWFKAHEPRAPLPWIGVIKRTFSEWNAHGAPRLGASLAFYSVLSVGPLLLIALSVAGLAFGHDRASTYLINEMRTLLGPDGAKAVEDILTHSHDKAKSTWATIIGVVTLLISASGFFGQLQAALNLIWDTPSGTSSAATIVKRRLLSFGMVLCVCLMLLFSLVVSAALAAFTGLFAGSLPAVGLQVTEWLLSLAVTTLLFALTFKVLPDVPIRWHEVWLGAFVTAILFAIGKSLIGLYLGRSALSSTYGAAGSMIILLVWIYYSAQIFFLGAEFTHVHARDRTGVRGPLPV